MLNVIERGRGLFRVSPETAFRREQEKAKRRLLDMHSSISGRVGTSVVNLRRELETLPLSLHSMFDTESSFVEGLVRVEQSIAVRYDAGEEERAKNSRDIAISTYRFINNQINHSSDPAKPSILPSFKRCNRAALAWGLRQTEELTGNEIEMGWSVNLLGKGLNNALTEADINGYLNEPPVVQ